MDEQWVDIPGFKGVYQLTITGKCRSLDRVTAYGRKRKGIVLKPYSYKGFYPVYDLRDSLGVRKPKSVHRLVAEVFLPNPENKALINHIDGNKLNSSIDNLEWCTQSENMKHAIRTGLKKYKKGLNSSLSKLTKEQVLKIISLHNSGLSTREIAKQFPVGKTTVHSVLSWDKEDIWNS